MRALKDRMTIMRSEGIEFAKIPWKNIGLLPALSMIPKPILKRGQGVIAEFIARGRENTPPGAARKIMEGRATELAYYHKPFLELGKLHGLTSPVDEAILEVITEHERGILNLTSLTKEQRRDILLKAYEISFQKPYVSRDPLKTFIVEWLAQFFSRELKVSGIENLEIVRENLKKHKSVVLLVNHLSHADHPTLSTAMRQNGFPDLAERLTFVAGMRLKDEFIAKIFNNAYARILVSTPTSTPQTEEENREAQRINLKGFFEASRLLNEGNLLVIYPEGTRSREGKLLKAIPTVSRYLENPNVGIILPVGIQGTGDLLPAGRKILRFKKTKISFGKPILPASVFKNVLDELPEDKRNNYKRDKKIRDEINEKIMDFVMRKISLLLPEEQRGAYKELKSEK
jgi:1-acyl-sn-glycerol-3-phosphate acyltransferase